MCTKHIGRTYRLARGAVNRLPGGAWLLGWTVHTHIANRLLRQALRERAGYARGMLLDLGCGGQPYRHLFSHVDDYIGLDLPPNEVVDVYGDGMSLPFGDGVFDTVLCNEVLEHVPEPFSLLSEAARVLRPGGVLLLTAPQTWGLHSEPHDFYRFTMYGLFYLAQKSGLEVLDVTPTSGFWATFVQRLTDTIISNYVGGRSQWVTEVVSLLLAPLLVVGYGLDKVFGKRGDTLDHVMVARKPFR